MTSRSSCVRIAALLALAALAGCRAGKPGAAQSGTIRWVKHHITVGGKRDRNPFPATASNIDDGKQAFTQYCMVCHGLDGQNTGVPFAATVDPPVPSLASDEVQSYTDGQLKWIIQHGVSPSGMPPSEGVFADDDMWKMVLYIRHLPKAGSLGEPAVYNGGSK
ncbi:c-type cytochrome [Silvibacterium sp.]|uniref:c-type cytochrome n=1 Tax=Silvibacterium sp. TaxID=1964179 RepID=UPI0039E42CB1